MRFRTSRVSPPCTSLLAQGTLPLAGLAMVSSPWGSAPETVLRSGFLRASPNCARAARLPEFESGSPQDWFLIIDIRNSLEQLLARGGA